MFADYETVFSTSAVFLCSIQVVKTLSPSAVSASPLNVDELVGSYHSLPIAITPLEI
jgi:hypothetical protein